MSTYNGDMVTYTIALVCDLLVGLVQLRTCILIAVIAALFIKRFVYDHEQPQSDDASFLSESSIEKEAARDLSNQSPVDMIQTTTESLDKPKVEYDGLERSVSTETDAVAVPADSSDQSHPSTSLSKDRQFTVETQTSIDEPPEKPNLEANHLPTQEANQTRRESSEDIRKRLQRPSCRCKRPAKSASMSEADMKRRSCGSGKSDSSKPVSVTYYYGKLIQVNSSNQVQIGDCNTMELNLSQGEQSADTSMEEEPEVILDDDEEDVDVCQLCSECRSRLTDDEKSLLAPLNDPLGLPQTPMADDQSQSESAFDESSQHSYDVSDVTTSTSCLYSSDDDLDVPMSPARRLRSRTCPASDEEKEQIFVEARIKIYNATEEHRKHTLGQLAPAERRIFKNPLKRKKHSTS